MAITIKRYAVGLVIEQSVPMGEETAVILSPEEERELYEVLHDALGAEHPAAPPRASGPPRFDAVATIVMGLATLREEMRRQGLVASDWSQEAVESTLCAAVERALPEGREVTMRWATDSTPLAVEVRRGTRVAVGATKRAMNAAAAALAMFGTAL
jgi:hypothetical protein